MKMSRGKRTSRLAMVGRLFVIVWGVILCTIKFFALLGFTIGMGAAFIGTLGGIGLVVGIGWLLVNVAADAAYRRDSAYRLFRKSGGDPYYDLTWFWPLNVDSDAVRRTGGSLATCPRCAEVFRGHNCPLCGANDLDYVRCQSCKCFTYDPDRHYESSQGLICSGCGLWLRDSSATDCAAFEVDSKSS